MYSIGQFLESTIVASYPAFPTPRFLSLACSMGTPLLVRRIQVSPSSRNDAGSCLFFRRFSFSSFSSRPISWSSLLLATDRAALCPPEDFGSLLGRVYMNECASEQNLVLTLFSVFYVYCPRNLLMQELQMDNCNWGQVAAIKVE